MGRPIFFYGDKKRPYGCFSQSSYASFTDPSSGLTFKCAEQFMMYSKAQIAGDSEAAEAIMEAGSPKGMKMIRRQVKGFDADEWDRVKCDVVAEGNYLKFSQKENEGIRAVLLGTGENMLVEAARGDMIWGTGFGEEDALAVPKTEWGQNLLGKALVDVRERTRKEMDDAAAAAKFAKSATSLPED